MPDLMLRAAGRDHGGIARPIRVDEQGNLIAKTPVKNLVTSYASVIEPNGYKTFSLTDLDVKELVISVRQHGVYGSWTISATAQTKDPITLGGTGSLDLPIVKENPDSEYGVAFIILPVIFQDMRISIRNETGVVTSLSVAIMGRY